MEGLILNSKFETLAILDAFESFIWTDRYRKPGDFEIYMPVEKAPIEHMLEGNYVWIRDSDRLMIIEDILIQTDAEIGPHITVNGRSLESYLDRRIISHRTAINENLQDGIQRLLYENVISPDYAPRRLPGMAFRASSDPRITSLWLTANYLGENLLEVIETICDQYDLGFKITFDEESSESFIFELYYGEDRSYSQDKNPWVIFSQKYDNLVNSNYYKSSKNLRTAAVVAGDADNEYGQEILDVEANPSLTGFERREMFVDASDIETQDPEVNEDSIRERLEKRNKTEMEIAAAIASAKAYAIAQTTAVYRNQLQQRGKEELSKTYITETFDGEIEARRQFVYGKDFFIGDVVQIRDQYGREASSRITEVVRSHDVSGEQLIPTFTTLLKK